MKVYTVILLQMMIWSGYTFLEWLSKHDQPIYNILMFLIFLYLGITIGNHIMKSTKATFAVTILSLAVYGSFHFLLSLMRA